MRDCGSRTASSAPGGHCCPLYRCRERRLDAAVLAQRQLLGEQDVDRLQGADLGMLQAPPAPVASSARPGRGEYGRARRGSARRACSRAALPRQAAADGVVELQRTRRDHVAGATELCGSAGSLPACLGAGRPVARRDAPLLAPFQDGMGGDQHPVLEDADLLGQGVDFHRAAACRVRHAVDIAADAHHALARDATLEPQHRPERRQRQWTQVRLLLGERLVDDPARACMHTRIGDRIEPAPQLVIEIGRLRKLRARKKSSRM